MAFPQQRHFHHPQQPPPPKSFRDIYNNNMDGQISSPATYFNIDDLAQHPPYVPPFHRAGPGVTPCGVIVDDQGRLELQWNLDLGLEPRKKRPKEQDFLENNTNNNNANNENNNNSQMSSVDFLQPQPRSVSTGLGLSLDNNNSNGRLASSGDSASALLGFAGDDFERELQRQDAELDRYIKIQGDRLRQAVLEKFQATQLQTLSYVEEKVMQKLREKEAEIEEINKKNVELEFRMEQLALEANAWQQRAQYNDSMINTLRLNLQQVVAQNRDSKEGSGESEVDDTASCNNGRAIDFHLLSKDGNEMKELMTCKVCRVNEVCMLLLPCKHLCLCKECERKTGCCPLCQSFKSMGVEVYM